MPNYILTLLSPDPDAEDHHKALWWHIYSKLSAPSSTLSTFNLYHWTIEFFLESPQDRSAYREPWDIAPVPAGFHCVSTEDPVYFSFPKPRNEALALVDGVGALINNINEKIFKQGFIRFNVCSDDGTTLAHEVRLIPYSLEVSRDAGFPHFSLRPSQDDNFIKLAPLAPASYSNNIFWGLDSETSQFIYRFKDSLQKHGLTNAAMRTGDGGGQQAPVNDTWGDNLRRTGFTDGDVLNDNLNSRNNYRALYACDPSRSQVDSLLFSIHSDGGSFGGIGRSDKVKNEDYDYYVIRIADGKKPDNPLLRILETKLAGTGKEEYAGSKRPEGFVLCNTPNPSSSKHGNTASLPFEIQYFRRTTDNGNKVEKSCIKNSPRPPELPNLPIRANPYTQVIANIQKKPSGDRGARRAIKSKGAFLGKSQGPRASAGTVMARVTNERSATAYLNRILEADQTAKEELGKIKGAGPITTSPVNQEWCHLLGHGDGGGEWVGNFVCGSYHCNTEQLAIESAIRQFSHHNHDMFMLHSTAYLLPTTEVGEGQDWFKTYLENAPEEHLPGQDYHSGTSVGRTAPIAALIRYKISVKQVPSLEHSPPAEAEMTPGRTSQGRTIIFDYTFEGQSEFFDINQYRIVYYTVLAAVRNFALAKIAQLQAIEAKDLHASLMGLDKEKDIVAGVNEALLEYPRLIAAATTSGPMQDDDDQ